MVPDALEYANNTAEIHITGGNARKRKLVKQAARWMLGYTLGTRLANNIILNITLEEGLKDTKFYGSVIWEDANHRPREYDMELCSYLKDLTNHAEYCKWKNKMIKADGPGKTNYFDLPWEIEARRDQEYILSDWKKAHGYHFKQKTGVIYSDNGDL